MRNGNLSFWLDRVEVTPPRTEPLRDDASVDIAIVGAGLTGLWTAWALARRDPSLSIAVFEAEQIGHGASGRNGGWLSAKAVGIRSVLERHHSGRSGVLETERLLERAMDDVVAILGADTIDAVRGGWLQVARSDAEHRRLAHSVHTSRRWDIGEDHLRLLSAEQVRERIAIDGAVGGLYSPLNYRVDPVKMLFALADRVLDSGVAIYTESRVTDIAPASLRVGQHRVTVRRRTVIATEGYTCRQRGQRRRMLPLNSSMVVTEPLTSDQWQQVGWDHAEGLSGAAHTYFYAQRTADGRIAIGGRGKPYRFGSRFDHRGEVDQPTVSALVALLRELFPQVVLQEAHAWCGVLGVTRDWSPFIDDSEHRVIRVGGYAGQGLAASHLAALIIADLITDPGSSLTSLPWVRRAPRRWEPEPLRWIGANGLYRAYAAADRLESRCANGRTSRLAVLADRITGR